MSVVAQRKKTVKDATIRKPVSAKKAGVVLPPTTVGASMDWNRLLSTTRVKGLFGQRSSVPISGDLRSEFDRDYGRTVFSTPVRRLQDKAQVFPLERHDAVRTRLTHSMEVSSVARSLGDTAERFLFKLWRSETRQAAGNSWNDSRDMRT